jgi:hypothetical protein
MTESESARRTLGVFPGDGGDLGVARAFDRWVGSRLGVVTTFVAADVRPDQRRRFVAERLTAVWEAGLVPLVTWEPFALGADGDCPVATVAGGEATGLLDAWASTVVAWLAESERRLVLRPAHEMNGSWYPWSAGEGVEPSDYRRMWRRLHERFTDAGVPGDRVRWLWCVNAESTVDLDPMAFYPGDDYVDLVGVDGYNFGDSADWSAWRGPRAVFEPAFERLRDSVDAPLTVPEFGCSSAYDGERRPDRKADWIADAFALFAEWDVRLAGYFNAAKETDWPVFAPADTAEGPYPADCTLDGRRYVAYPSVREAMVRYTDG